MVRALDLLLDGRVFNFWPCAFTQWQIPAEVDWLS